MSESNANLHIIVIVTDKANHSLHFKTRVAAMVMHNNLSKARDDYANNNQEPKGLTVSLADDFDTETVLQLSTLINHQIGSLDGDHEVERMRQVSKMHSDLELGNLMANDPGLKEAQRKASARAAIVRPAIGG